MMHLLVWILSVPGVLAAMQVAPGDPHAVGSKLPAYQVENDAGKALDLRSFKGPLLVNVWASWCAPCERELPVLSQIHRVWQPRGLTVVGVSVDAIKTGPRRIVDKYKLPFEVVYDHPNAAADTLAVKLLPSTFVYNHKHELVFFRPDVLRHDDPELKAALEAAVARP
jgi:peroxiredoxin